MLPFPPMWSRRPTRSAVLAAVVGSFVALQCGRDEFDLLPAETISSAGGETASPEGGRSMGLPSGGASSGGSAASGGGGSSGGRSSVGPPPGPGRCTVPEHCSGSYPFCSTNGYCVQCREEDGVVQGCGPPPGPQFCTNGFCAYCREVDGVAQGCGEPPAPSYCSEQGYCVPCKTVNGRDMGCPRNWGCHQYRCYAKCDPALGDEQCGIYVCSPNLELCVECNTDKNCASRPDAPYCDGVRCVECLEHEDCFSNKCSFGICQ